MMFFLKGILIGLIFGVPAGAIGALCVQRSFLYGTKGGMITGFGSSIADTFYATVGAFGVRIISDFLTEYQTVIHLLGGLLILAMGISILRKKKISDAENKDNMSYLTMFMSALGVGITNPVALIAFLFAFSYFGINDKQGVIYSIILVTGVFIGTFIWWIILTSVTKIIKKKYNLKVFNRINKIFGIIMISFGVILFIKIIFKR